MKYAVQKSTTPRRHTFLFLASAPSRITFHEFRTPMLTYMLLGLAAGLLTGILIAWYRRQN